MKFESEDAFREWRRAYYNTFNSPDGLKVLKDMLEWSGMFDDCVETDPFRYGVREGRRQAMLRIIRNLHLDLDEIFQVYRGARVNLTEPPEEI